MHASYHDHNVSLFNPISRVLRTRKYLGISSAFGLTYALGYMILVGIISYVPGLTSATGDYPMIRFTSFGISVIPFNDTSFFIVYEALAFLVASSFLVGLNIALMFYSRDIGALCGIHQNKAGGAKGLLGLVPSFFASFSCCGGGLIAIAIGPAVFSYLSIYGRYMALLTVLALAAGTYIMAKRTYRMERCA